MNLLYPQIQISTPATQPQTLASQSISVGNIVSSFNQSQKNDILEIQKRAQNIMGEFLYESNNETTRDLMQSRLDSMLNAFIGNKSISDYDVKVTSNDDLRRTFTCEYDPLTHECNSYSEYKMKKAIVSGDKPLMPEDEFNRQHKYTERNDFVVDIAVMPQNQLKFVNLSFSVS